MRFWKIYKKITRLPLLVPNLTKLSVVFVLKSTLNFIRGKKEKISGDFSSFTKLCREKINEALKF